jgi:hypothetical protein
MIPVTQHNNNNNHNHTQSFIKNKTPIPTLTIHPHMKQSMKIQVYTRIQTNNQIIAITQDQLANLAQEDPLVSLCIQKKWSLMEFQHVNEAY